jgi:hypothetical protein
LSYTHRKSAGQSGTNRTTQVEISNLVRLTFPGRVTGRNFQPRSAYFSGSGQSPPIQDATLWARELRSRRSPQQQILMHPRLCSYILHKTGAHPQSAHPFHTCTLGTETLCPTSTSPERMCRVPQLQTSASATERSRGWSSGKPATGDVGDIQYLQPDLDYAPITGKKTTSPNAGA